MCTFLWTLYISMLGTRPLYNLSKLNSCMHADNRTKILMLFPDVATSVTPQSSQQHQPIMNGISQ